ncbi:hypothetical protein LLG90_25930, partial [Aromatoleum toluclasticum]|uniref:hypothetical protein n=1 Tax=Aromatoleum toluclasticum TaxID=92003 RepID=UPI001D1806F8
MGFVAGKKSSTSVTLPSPPHQVADQLEQLYAKRTLTGEIEIFGPGGEKIPLGGSYGDLYLDRVISGLALPPSGGLANVVGPGVAYVNGARVASVGASITLSANSDNYIDFTSSGAFVVSPVAAAAAAPSVASDSIRLGYVTTNATTVTARVTAALDSLGNWMGNTMQMDACQLRRANNASLGGTVVSLSFPAGSVLLDNAHMYDSTLPTRITIQRAGLYKVSYSAVLGKGAIDSVRLRL